MIRRIAALITLGMYSSTSFKSDNSVSLTEFRVAIAVSLGSPCPCSRGHRHQRGSSRVRRISVPDSHDQLGCICKHTTSIKATTILCIGLERVQLLQERRLPGRVVVVGDLSQVALHTEADELGLHLLGTPPGIQLRIHPLFDLRGDEAEPADGAHDG